MGKIKEIAIEEEMAAKCPGENNWSPNMIGEWSRDMLMNESKLNMATIARMKPREIAPSTYNHLANSALDRDIKKMLGFFKVEDRPVLEKGKLLVFPYFGVKDFARVRLENPFDDNKYFSPISGGTHLYFLEGDENKIQKTSIPIVLCEGEKKAAKVAQEGGDKLLAIGLPGSNTFFSSPEHRKIDFAGRVVHLAFDMDFREKLEKIGVHVINVFLWLMKRRAIPKILTWKEGKGIDDYLAAQEEPGAALSQLLDNSHENLLDGFQGDAEHFPHATQFVKRLAKSMAAKTEKYEINLDKPEATAIFGDMGAKSRLGVSFSAFWAKVVKEKGFRVSEKWLTIGDTGKPEVVPGVAAESYVEKTHGDLIYATKAFWSYKKGLWSILDPEYVQRGIQNMIGAKMAKKRVIEDVFFQTRNLTMMSPDFGFNIKNPYLLNFQDGTLDISTPGNEIFRDHDKKDYLIHQFPFKYDPKAQCEEWEDFLKSLWLSEETISRLQEWIGYTLVPIVKIHKCLFLKGEGRNGKSTFLEVIAALVGEDGASNIAPHDLTERFRSYELQGKLINFCCDADTTQAFSDKFKVLVDGTKIMGERKGQDPFYFRSHAVVMFAANRYIPSRDRTTGFFERFDLVEFTRYLAPEERDPDLLEKLCKNLPGILNWALEGLRRLRANNWLFTHSPDMEEKSKEFQKFVSPIQQYLEERYDAEIFVKKHDGRILKDELKGDCAIWMERNNYRDYNLGTLTQEMNSLGYAYHRLRTGVGNKRAWFFVGLAKY